MDLLKNDVKALFLRFLIPAISSAIAVATYSLVDTIAIGQGVGAEGTAACAVVLPIFSIANFIALLCGIGGCVLRSQAKGEGNEEKGNACFTSAVCMVALFTLIVWAVGNLVQDDFYTLCGADETLLPYAKEYGTWIFACLPSFVMTAFLGAFIRTDGSPKYVMCSTLIGGLVNIVGDWLFVFPFNMGMEGAAIATVLGSMTQALLLLGYILARRTSLKIVRPHHWMRAFRKIAVVGFGSGIGALSVIAVSFIANNQIMKYCGAPSLAVYGVLGTVSALFISIFSGIGQAAQPIVSENYGAGKHNRYWKAENFGMKTAVLLGTLFTMICVAFPIEVTGVFMKMTPEVEEVTPFILRVYALSFLPLAINTFVTYFLQSVTQAKMATLVSLSRGLVLNGAFLYLFPLLVGGNGVWWAIFFSELVTAFISILYLYRLYGRYQRLEYKES